MNFSEKIANIKLVGLDVDGVLTTGKIILDENGSEYKIFDAKDGFAVKIAIEKGIEIALISGRSSKAVNHRAEELGIAEVHQGIRNKVKVLNKIRISKDVEWGKILYMGDDLNDKEVMKKVGLACAPQDGSKEIKKIADYITENKGGEGAVKEVIKNLLINQNKWSY